MRKAPKRGHRVTNRTLKHVGPPASHGLLAVAIRPHTPLIQPHGANAVRATDGFLALVRCHRSRGFARPLHTGLTVPFFPNSSFGPATAFLKGTILFKTRTKRQSLVNAHRQCRWLTELQFAYFRPIVALTPTFTR